MPGNVPTKLTEMMTQHFGLLYMKEKNYQGSLLATCTAAPSSLSFLKLIDLSSAMLMQLAI